MKHSRKNPLLRTAALGIVLLLLAGCAEIRDNRVSVMLLECPGIRVVGNNPVLVNAGGDAVFNVELDDGYILLQSSGDYRYDADAKTVTVPRVLYPASVPLDTLESDGTPCEISFSDPLQKGKIYTSLPEGTYPAGMKITLDCEPVEGYAFKGWTKNAPLSHGGNVLAYRADVTLTITEGMRIFANFKSENPLIPKASKRTVLYQANGGTYASTGKTFTTVDYSIGFWQCPNCLPGKDYFVREGYQLIEYNTKADGSGDAYSLGSKVILPKDDSEVLTLFCIWEKETPASDFTYTTNGSNVTITGCKSTAKTIVVPAKIDGKNVTTIASNAFKGLNVETMIFPNTITTVQANAMYDCAKLNTFYLHDNVTTIPDNAIAGKNDFRNFRLNSAMTPKYCNSVEGNFPVKWERLVMSEKPCIIVMSGSSSLNGLNSPMMEEAFNDKYTVVNYGTNAGTCGCLYMEFVSHFVEKGDILIDAPEMGGDQAGNMNITWKIFRATESMCNIWRYVDVSRYAKLFSSIQEHNKTRATMGNTNYEQYSTGMDMWGDLQNADRAKLNSPNYHAGSTFSLSNTIFSGTAAKNLNAAYKMLQDAGCTVYFSCAPFNANGMTAAAKQEKTQDAYNDSLHANLSVPVISKVQDYMIKGEWMYNSDYHPNNFGRDYRTDNLIRDLKAQMVKDGTWSE